ncbi:MAG: DUF1501 domain-containing protein [Planctomycetes bacterium]|nr:DUF1501 domain-containing protein [Planctomycetota bacterium]
MNVKRSMRVAAFVITVVVTSVSVRADDGKTGNGKQTAVLPENDDVANLAATIDRLIAAKWKENNVIPAPIADDAEFLRRVTLSIAGRIPRVSDVRAFLADKSPHKRRLTVSNLLEEAGYITNFTTIWRKVMLPEANADFQVRFLVPGFEAWLRQKLTDNTPYDQLVRELLTTKLDGGSNNRNFYSRLGTASPLAFFQAKQIKPENLAAATSRIFLGRRIECAQCHDHPFNDWKRDQFWSFAAFFAGIERAGGNGVFSRVKEIPDRRELAIPDTDRVVQAAYFDGSEPRWKFRTSARQTLAEWMTAPKNPYFAQTAVNRIWAHLFGMGIVDPVDDFDNNSDPRLLKQLADEFVKYQFDVKPGYANGGEFKPIKTAVPGVEICEHLPMLAKQMKHVVPVRSMSTKEGDHARATYFLRTGYLPQGPVQYPTLGSVLSKELGGTESDLPNYVSVGPYRFLSPAAYSPGFLGPKYAPLVVGGNGLSIVQTQGNAYEQALKVRNLSLPDGVDLSQADARLSLLKGLENEFISGRPGISPQSHITAYSQAVRMMRSEAIKAFSLDNEPAKLRDKYGRNQFGQSCLLARRLIEQGVPFVEISLNGVQGNQSFAWDTHRNNFPSLKALCGVLDPGWATLLEDLKDRGRLDDTLVVWMGEFGRTPKINRTKGRDHFPAAWSTVLAGGGVKGGRVVGKTSADGMKVEDRPVSVPDLLATICKALGLDPRKQNMSNIGRPIRLADPKAKPIKEILL